MHRNRYAGSACPVDCSAPNAPHPGHARHLPWLPPGRCGSRIPLMPISIPSRACGSRSRRTASRKVKPSGGSLGPRGSCTGPSDHPTTGPAAARPIAGSQPYWHGTTALLQGSESRPIVDPRRLCHGALGKRADEPVAAIARRTVQSRFALIVTSIKATHGRSTEGAYAHI